jgi:hypothetical protein
MIDPNRVYARQKNWPELRRRGLNPVATVVAAKMLRADIPLHTIAERFGVPIPAVAALAERIGVLHRRVLEDEEGRVDLTFAIGWLGILGGGCVAWAFAGESRTAACLV